MEDKIEEARVLLSGARNVTVLTGAGISTDSGIPDFRGPNGIWTLDPDAEKVTDIHHYVTTPRIRAKTWARYMDGSWDDYEPNDGHRSIAKLSERNQLLALITQNIDGLHVKSGIPEERVLELHGHLRTATCLDCDAKFSAGEIDDDVCRTCEGLVKPDVVFFGENLDPLLYHKAESASVSCDVMLVVGTTLLVWPVADLPMYAEANGIPVIYVNGSNPPASAYTTINLIGSISEILPQII